MPRRRSMTESLTYSSSQQRYVLQNFLLYIRPDWKRLCKPSGRAKAVCVVEVIHIHIYAGSSRIYVHNKFSVHNFHWYREIATNARNNQINRAALYFSSSWLHAQCLLCTVMNQWLIVGIFSSWSSYVQLYMYLQPKLVEFCESMHVSLPDGTILRIRKKRFQRW